MSAKHDDTLAAEIAQLDGLGLEALRNLWRQRLGSPQHFASTEMTRLWLAWELQAKARAQGLWNLAMSDRIGNRDYAPLAEIMGRLPWAAEVFNCQAPDVPNMIMLQHAASPAQKQQWLQVL